MASADDEPVVELEPFEAQRLLEEERAPAETGGEAAEESDASSSQLELPAGVELPVVPGYVVEGFIGRGATGIVYRARQQAVDRPVALKVLHPELVTNNRAVRRLKREARLAARLAHPSIISAIDMGVQDGRWWYAMELVEGVSLSRRIAERGSLTERECLRLFSPLCDALQHAHEVGVVHRDIKPANILVDRRGRARLVDLGLAMGHNDPSITKTGSTLGTPHYVSPEQARDPSQADIRSDIWSIGATMYHAVCGRPPFSFDAAEGGSGGVAEVLSRVLYQPVVDPREMASDLSKGFSLLLRKCLTRDPLQRYQEPWELVADIETLRERRRLDLRGSQIDSFASRRPAWVGRAAWAAAALAAVVLTWLLTAQPWKEPRTTPVTAAGPSLGDWPELLAIKEAFDADELRPADALLELDSPNLGTLPEEARFLRSDLVVHVREALDRTVSAIVAESGAVIDVALEQHDFPAADELLDVEFPRQLAARTGFRGVGDLPPGHIAATAADFVVEGRERLGAARTEALRTAEQALQRALAELLEAEHRTLVEAGRYRDAIAWLSREAPSNWLEREGVSLDLRGLDEAERAQVIGAIELRLRTEASAIRYGASAAALAARNDVEDAEEAAQLMIGRGEVRNDRSAADGLREAIRNRNAEAGFDPDQLPVEMALEYSAGLEAALDGVERAEARKREEIARGDLRRLKRVVAALSLERKYGSARSVLVQARDEAWRASTHGDIDLRLAELDLLDEVLERAAAGVVEAEGERMTLDFGGVKHPGRLELTTSRPLQDGFLLRSRSGGRRAIPVVFVDEDDVGKARLLGARDALGLAGLGRFEGLEARERLAAAAFLLAEGRADEAAKALPVESAQGFEALVWDLEERIEFERAAARAEEAARENQEDAAAPSPSATSSSRSVTLESIYGTPIQEGVGNDVRLVWWFVDEREPPTALRKTLRTPLRRGDERFGGWRIGEPWRASGDGLELDSSVRDKAAFLRSDFGPSLRVLPPVDRSQGVRVKLTLVPGEPYPAEDFFAVTVEGYHALLTDGRVWFGMGDLRTLYDHVVEGDVEDLPGFRSWSGPTFKKGQEISIEIAVRPKRLEELKVGGQVLATNKALRAQDRDDNLVRLRSRGPVTLVGAELIAEQKRVR